MNKVWAIESGGYSDYRVHAIYSTRELAQRILDYVNDGDAWPKARIEEYQLDPAVIEVRAGLKLFNICMAADGTVETINEAEEHGVYEVFSSGWRWWLRSKAPAYENTDIQDAVTGYVFARNEQHAIQMTNDYRTRQLAER